jgi:hypothetical protein
MTGVTKFRIRSFTARAAIQFGSEAWVVKKGDEQRLEAIQTKFLRRLLRITELDRERNRSFWDKLCVCVCAEHCSVNRTVSPKWLQHFHRMDTNGIPKQALQYRLKGKRHIGRLRKRFREQLHLQG